AAGGALRALPAPAPPGRLRGRPAGGPRRGKAGPAGLLRRPARGEAGRPAAAGEAGLLPGPGAQPARAGLHAAAGGHAARAARAGSAPAGSARAGFEGETAATRAHSLLALARFLAGILQRQRAEQDAGLGAVAHAQLLEDGAHVRLDRALLDAEFVGDLLVEPAFGDPGKHLELLRAERGQAGGDLVLTRLGR